MRYCEFEGCTHQGDLADMVKTPNGEWYCPEHARVLGLKEGD